MSGHATRESDLELLRWLGVRAVRYPVLWERVAPEGVGAARWEWSDRRLERLRALGVRPIIGLLHHGSGPRDTSLLNPAFPQKLATYARAVAERYPWALDWTPVNEPLTTARLSAMYGHWYPHARSFSEFVRALVNQCAAVRLAMREIRAAIPAARLIQTEDLSRVSGTASLGARAEMDQRIRLLSLDLLTGKVDEQHPLWRDLLAAGATAAELHELADRPERIDVLGLNYYVTSDRFGRLAPLLPACAARRRRAASLRGRRGGARRGRRALGPSGDARGSLAPLPLPARHHRGPPRLCARRTAALAGRGVARGRAGERCRRRRTGRDRLVFAGQLRLGPAGPRGSRQLRARAVRSPRAHAATDRARPRGARARAWRALRQPGARRRGLVAPRRPGRVPCPGRGRCGRARPSRPSRPSRSWRRRGPARACAGGHRSRWHPGTGVRARGAGARAACGPARPGGPGHHRSPRGGHALRFAAAVGGDQRGRVRPRRRRRA